LFGTRIEILYGRGKMLLLYGLAGIVGNIVSIFLMEYRSIGASGAIYGLMGAALVTAHEGGCRKIGMNYSTLLLWAAVGLLMGFLEPEVNQFAHIGGFFMGVLLSLLMVKWKKKQKSSIS